MTPNKSSTLSATSSIEQGQTHHKALADINCKDTGIALQTDLSSPTTDVFNRVTDSHRKASPLRKKTSRPGITSSQSCSENFIDISKEGLGAHLGEHTARGTRSLPESKLHITTWNLRWSTWP